MDGGVGRSWPQQSQSSGKDSGVYSKDIEKASEGFNEGSHVI